MTSAKSLYLLRHGETDMKNRYVGSLDVPLSPIGCEQIGQLATTLDSTSFDCIFCSPMIRCRQTLDLLALKQTAEYIDSLKEIDFGRWEGKTFDEIVHQDKERVDSWVQDPERFCFPAGEAVADFQKRVRDVKELIAGCKHQRILIVAHGGVLRYLLCYFLRLSIKNYLVFDVQPGKMCELRLYPEGGVLTQFNCSG